MKLTMLKKIAIAAAVILMSVSTTACKPGSSSNVSIDGLNYNVEFVGGNVLLSMTLTTVQIDGGITLPIPKYPHSSLQVGPDFLSNGTLIVLTINAADFLGSNGNFFDPHRLPDGRPLPAVAAGELPAIAVQIPKLFNTVFYVGPKVIGFFVPFKLGANADAILTFRFNDNNNKPIGILALVGAVTQGYQSGVLYMMRADLMGIIKGDGSSPL